MDSSPWLPSGSRSATAGGRTVPVHYPTLPRSKIPGPRPLPGNLSNHIKLNQTIEILNAAPKGKIGPLPKAIDSGRKGGRFCWESPGVTTWRKNMRAIMVHGVGTQACHQDVAPRPGAKGGDLWLAGRGGSVRSPAFTGGGKGTRFYT